jgi:folylpolyglutamate synthase/dihydropteroate synthase
MREQIDWLFAQQERGMHPGLERVRRLLDRLGNPERSFRSVQVGGTNGKGSVTRLISSTMFEAAKLEPDWGRIGEYTCTSSTSAFGWMVSRFLTRISSD